MKPISILLCAVFVACAGGPVGMTEGEQCTIYEDYGANWGNSLIAAKIDDPCRAVRLITMAAKLPVIEWKRRYTLLFDDWATKMEAVVQDNINYADLQNLVLMEVSKLNTKAGMTLLVVSDGIFVFTERGLLKDKDVELMLALIAHLRKEVKKMEVLM